MMPAELPFFIVGTVASIVQYEKTAYIRVANGNVYHVFPFTPGINFSDLSVGKRVECEVTTKLTRVLSAKVID